MTRVMKEGDRIECIYDGGPAAAIAKGSDCDEHIALGTVTSIYVDTDGVASEGVLTGLVYFDEPDLEIIPRRDEINIAAFKWDDNRGLWVLMPEKEYEALYCSLDNRPTIEHMSDRAKNL